MRPRALFGALVLLLAATARPAAAQIAIGEGDTSRYDALYGKPVDVSIDDLVQESSAYANRAVRTKGRLDMLFDSNQRAYAMRGMLYTIRIVPVQEVAYEWE